MKTLFPLVARRWLSVAWSLLVAARAAYARGGARSLFFELKAHALALRRGESPEHYVRTKCEALGVSAGSPSYSAVLAWAWSVVNFVESKESN